MLKLLPLVLLAACTTEGNTVSGHWVTSSSLFDGTPGGCIGDATVVVRSGATVVRDQRACDDEGFDITVPLDVTRATIEVRDDWSDTWTRELPVIDGDVDIGTIHFDHFGDSD